MAALYYWVSSSPHCSVVRGSGCQLTGLSLYTLLTCSSRLKFEFDFSCFDSFRVRCIRIDHLPEKMGCFSNIANWINRVLRSPFWPLQICGFNLLWGPADAPVAVNSFPVSTAHHLIDYAAVDGGKDFGAGHLITGSVTAIRLHNSEFRKLVSDCYFYCVSWPESSHAPLFSLTNY